jgi:anti-sigma B factor antagonist
MTARIEESGTSIRIHVDGDLDHAASESLKQVFSTLALAGKQTVVFDFRHVAYVGSAGLGKLLLFYKRLSTSGIKMRLEGAQAPVQTLLKELKMDSLFPVS